jgi:hypothetical protein
MTTVLIAQALTETGDAGVKYIRASAEDAHETLPTTLGRTLMSYYGQPASVEALISYGDQLINPGTFETERPPFAGRFTHTVTDLLEKNDGMPVYVYDGSIWLYYSEEYEGRPLALFLEETAKPSSTNIVHQPVALQTPVGATHDLLNPAGIEFMTPGTNWRGLMPSTEAGAFRVIALPIGKNPQSFRLLEINFLAGTWYDITPGNLDLRLPLRQVVKMHAGEKLKVIARNDEGGWEELRDAAEFYTFAHLTDRALWYLTPNEHHVETEAEGPYRATAYLLYDEQRAAHADITA